MLKKFQAHITSRNLFNQSSQLLLAISAGVDSTVLLHLLMQSGYKPALAHCNFQLRGKDSVADEQFCRQLAKKYKLTFHCKRFDVQGYCESKGVNTQLAARQLRYAWFHELMEEGGYNFVLTAHHAGDVVETIFINLLRGTGINGLKGIPESNQKVIRPLLPFTKEEIKRYAKTNNLKFRLDKSNNENKYERNFIRNKVLPLLRQLNPSLEETFLRNSFHFQQEAGIVKEFLSNKAVDYCTQTHDSLFINRNRLRHEHYLESILNYILGGYGFNGTQLRNIAEIVRSAEGVGKGFRTATHVLTVDRSDLIVKAVPGPNETLYIKDLAHLKKLSFIKTVGLKQFKLPHASEFIVSQRKLVFPLTIRGRKTGDRFQPFGLKGSKLLSDFMKEQKWNSFEKENASLLVNGNGEIMWVMGYRSDERYRVSGKEADLLKLKIVG